MQRLLIPFILALSLPACVLAQQWRISGLESTSSIRLTNDRYFDGNSLWGYMNGGADLYLEYGFRALRVQDLVVDSQEVRLEIFRMDDPFASRALYSALTGGLSDSTWKRPWSFNSYQVQIVHNDCYINIVNYTGSGRGLRACIDVSELVGRRFTHLRIDTPPPLMNNKGTWQAFFGPLGCRMLAPELEQLTGELAYGVAWVQKKKESLQNTAMLYPGEGGSPLSDSLKNKTLEMFRVKNDEDGAMRIEWMNEKKKDSGEGLW